MLDHYFQQRRLNPDMVTVPGWASLAASVLRPAGSAPGLDGEPYEVYHMGARFVVCLLGQAFHAAQHDDAALDAVLGPSVDLLVWIPKHPAAEDPAGMRPLQLPTCFRRLYL